MEQSQAGSDPHDSGADSMETGHTEQPQADSDPHDPGQEPHTVQEVTMERGTLDFQDQNGVISGDVCPGGVIRGNGDLRVQGNVAGASQQLCVIEVSGAVVLEHGASFAKIQARSLQVQGDVEGCRIRSDLHVEIQGNLSDSQISLGHRRKEIQILRQLRSEIQKTEQHVEELKVRIGSGGRRFVRDYPRVELRMGNILIPTQRELQVDLHSFYDAIRGRSTEEVDRALQEFYLRVMVGALTRSNRDYISRNPSRHKVFLKLVEDLRLHITNIREADKSRDHLLVLTARRQKILEEMKVPPVQGLRVVGVVSDGVTVQLLQYGGFEETTSGMVEMEEKSAELRTVKTDSGLVLETTDLEGENHAAPVQSSGLQNGRFVPVEGCVQWRPEGA